MRRAVHLHVCAWFAYSAAAAAAQYGWTALSMAAENGHADCARLLLDAGADTEATTNVRATCGMMGAGVS